MTTCLRTATILLGAAAVSTVGLVASACGGRVRFEPEAADAGRADAGASDATMDVARGEAGVDADGPDDADAPDRSAPEAGIDAQTLDAQMRDAGIDATRADAGMCARGAIGQACSGTCEDGLVCDDGVCRASCRTEPCCTDVGIVCVDGSEPATSVCTEGCALVDDPICGEGLGCRFFPMEGTLDVLTYCDTVDDSRSEGDACARTDECPRGTVCIGFGYCATMCRSEAGSCGDERTCFNFLPHVRFGDSEYGYCSARCRFAPDEGCAAGTTCFPVFDSRFGPGRYYGLCRPAGPGVEGDPCMDYRDCGASMVCVESACRRLCRRDVPRDCSAGSSCRAFEPALVTDTGDVGFCGL